MDNNLDDDVKSLLAILQPNTVKESPKKAKKSQEDNKTDSGTKAIQQNTATKKEKKPVTIPNSFLSDIDEPADKSIYNSKVLIREEVYEVFMSLKRAKKMKSVSTLIDFALEEYIKNHKEDIKNVLTHKTNGIL